MTMRFIPSVNPGDSVGIKPTFPVNAQVKGDFLYLRDANGNQIAGRSVSDGDEITVLKVDHTKQLALVQYPAGTIYRQGYVTNATSIIKYKNEYNWLNGSTPETVYDVDKKTQIGSLDPREKATILYKVDGMTALVYDTSKGKMTKSGLVHYAGSGGSTGGGDINGIAPGGEVPGGFTYPNNAQVVGDDLYLRDANGNQISGRVVSNGDKITVLDVGYTKQLALVQYPAGSVVRQGYVTNATNLIRYFKQGEWLNGSTTEPVLDENGGSLGSLSPYEAATPLYKKNGMTHVVYDTSKGPNTKSGYVKFEGLPELPDTSIQIPSVSHSQATVEVYGLSGRSRQLKVYKIGSGSKVLFAGFALHGWEDKWDNDGLALVNIANSLISKIGDYKEQNGLHGWTVYIAPCMNPDGVVVRGTHNGPGRCAVKSRVDMNRCFPRGFSAQYNSRNYTGPEALGAQEAVALKNFIEKINKTADELVVIDAHGWLGCTYGNSSIAQYFTKQFGFSHKGESFGGYFSYWAQGLPRTRGLLLEYPNTNSYNEVINRNYIGKTFNAIINILKNNPNGGDVDNGGSDSNEVPYNATGKIKNVAETSVLNVRSGPSTSNSVIGTLKLGDIVTIVAKVKTAGEIYDWYKIKFNSGYGYIRSDFVEINTNNTEGEIEFFSNGKVINVSTHLNIRKEASTSSEIIGTLANGAFVEIVAKKGDWYKIRFVNSYGYVNKDYIELIDDVITNPEYPIKEIGSVVNVSSVLNVRSNASVDSAIIGVLKLMDSVKIVAEKGEWYKISFISDFGLYGYVKKEFIEIERTYSYAVAMTKLEALANNFGFKSLAEVDVLEKKVVYADSTGVLTITQKLSQKQSQTIGGKEYYLQVKNGIPSLIFSGTHENIKFLTELGKYKDFDDARGKLLTIAETIGDGLITIKFKPLKLAIGIEVRLFYKNFDGEEVGIYYNILIDFDPVNNDRDFLNRLVQNGTLPIFPKPIPEENLGYLDDILKVGGITVLLAVVLYGVSGMAIPVSIVNGVALIGTAAMNLIGKVINSINYGHNLLIPGTK